jgi:copper(I)-binding protein
MDGDGVMRMREMQNGIAIPQGETVTLERGGLHIMLLGLTRPLEQGDEFELVLQFEHHAPLTLMVPVDLNHGTGHGHNHSNHTN